MIAIRIRKINSVEFTDFAAGAPCWTYKASASVTLFSLMRFAAYAARYLCSSCGLLAHNATQQMHFTQLNFVFQSHFQTQISL